VVGGGSDGRQGKWEELVWCSQEDSESESPQMETWEREIVLELFVIVLEK